MSNPPTYDGYEGGPAPVPPPYEWALQEAERERVIAEREAHLSASRARVEAELGAEKLLRKEAELIEVSKMSDIEYWLWSVRRQGWIKETSRNELLVLLNRGVKGPVIDDTFGPKDTRRRAWAESEAARYVGKLTEMGVKLPPPAY